MEMTFDLDNTMDLLNFRTDEDLLKVDDEDFHHLDVDAGWMSMGMDVSSDLNLLGFDMNHDMASTGDFHLHNAQHHNHHHHNNNNAPTKSNKPVIQHGLDFEGMCGSIMQPPAPAVHEQQQQQPKRKYRKRKSDSEAAGIRKKTLGQKFQSTGNESVLQKQAGGMKKFSSAPVVPMQSMDFAANATKFIKPQQIRTTMSDDDDSTCPPPTPKIKQTSAFRGVSCCGKDRKWQARIRDANKVRYLGRFPTEVEAALVYDDAARNLKGDKAPTNFVLMDEETTEMLKQAFVENGNVVPDRLGHLIARGRGKSNNTPSNKKAQRINVPQAQQHHFDFPDSPLAKVHTKTPAISPANKFKPSPNAQVQSRLQLDSRNIKKSFPSGTPMLNHSIRV